MDPRGIGYYIKNINDKLKVLADAQLKRHNLTLSQSRVLAYLMARGGQATQKQIEEFLEVRHPTVVGILSRMEQNGHVTTWFDEGQRSKRVELTAQAHAIGQDMAAMIRRQEAEMLRELTAEQVAALEQTLLVIHQNLK